MSNNVEKYQDAITDDTTFWYVMTHLDPALIDKLLQIENEQRFSRGLPTIFYVIPFRYMVRANAGRLDNVADNNELRDYLHNFVFIKATKREIDELVNMPWNRTGRLHLVHYCNRSGIPIKTTQEEMQPLLKFFIEQHQKFSFIPYSDDLAANDTVYICRGAFKEYKASVIEVLHKADGINLTLGIPMFNNEVMMKLYDYLPSDVEIRGKLEHLFDPIFLQSMEADLLDILRCRVLRRETDETHVEAMTKLNAYRILHYLKFEDSAMHRYFQTLMLLCATLCKDRSVMNNLIPIIQRTIESSKSPKSDDECFRLAVLFFATKNVDYRKATREYCHNQEVHSPSLMAIIPLVKKVQLRS